MVRVQFLSKKAVHRINRTMAFKFAAPLLNTLPAIPKAPSSPVFKYDLGAIEFGDAFCEKIKWKYVSSGVSVPNEKRDHQESGGRS